jgi:LAO/AO transport system kinase
VDVVRVSDTAVVISVPGLGDEVQALKAGLLEIADVLVVNKCDREGADRTATDLATMLALRAGGAGATEIVKTSASKGEGIDDLLAAIERHGEAQRASGRWARRRQERAESRVRAILFDRLRKTADRRIDAAGGMAALAADAAAARRDPYSVAETLAGAE